MGIVTIENNKFIYMEQEQKSILLDCENYLSNKSRIPLHSSEEEIVTIPRLILKLMQEHSMYLEGLDGEKESLRYMLTDVLLISRLIQSPSPVKVVEIGGDNGMMSYHLAKILGSFHKQSFLCSVCNTIGNESGNQWVDRIALVEAPPRLSMLVADYDTTQLQEENFNIVIINGSVCFQEPYPVIQEAKRLVHKEGIILCCVENQPLLESCFKLLFSEREEYSLTPLSKVLLTQMKREGV